MRHLQSFKYVKLIVETGSIRGAAEHFTISPSALNRHIQTLEEDLEIQIFERLNKGVRLSTEGELFYQFALAQLAGFERLRSQIHDVKGLRIGHVRIGVSADLSQTFLHEQIAQYQDEFPNVSFELLRIDRNALETALSENQIDFAFFYQPILGKTLQIIHAVEIPVCAALPIGTIGGRKDGLRLYDLLDHSILMPPKGTALRMQLDAACEKQRLEFRVKMECADPLEHLRTCRHSRIAFALPFQTDMRGFETSGFRFVEIAATDVAPGFASIVTTSHKFMPIAAQKFLERIVLALES